MTDDQTQNSSNGGSDNLKVRGFKIFRKIARSTAPAFRFEIDSDLYTFQIKYGDVEGTEDLGSISYIFKVSVEADSDLSKPVDYHEPAAKELEGFVKSRFVDSAGVKNASMSVCERWNEEHADVDQSCVVTLVLNVTGQAFRYKKIPFS